MAWSMDGVIDSDELASILKLLPDRETQADIQLAVSMDGNLIQGESVSARGENTLAVLGYHIKLQINTSDSGNLNLGSLWIIRTIDAASATLSSALKSGSGTSKKRFLVELDVYKAGGSAITGIGSAPVIRFVLENARLIFQSFQTNNSNGIPTEVLAFTYKSIEVNTAPQLSSGITGAVRTCILSN
jgi:type VI protein secretion system component Hcp